ncbi:MAG: hypothetical protein ABIQ97_01195 [Lysobacteraceae bacterium]
MSPLLALLDPSVGESSTCGRGIGGSGRGGSAVATCPTAGDAGVGAAGLTGAVAEPLVVAMGGIFVATSGRNGGGEGAATGFGRAGEAIGAGDVASGVGATFTTSSFAGSAGATGEAAVGVGLATGTGFAGVVMPRLIDALIASLRFIGPGAGGGMGGATARVGAVTTGRDGAAGDAAEVGVVGAASTDRGAIVLDGPLAGARLVAAVAVGFGAEVGAAATTTTGTTVVGTIGAVAATGACGTAASAVMTDAAGVEGAGVTAVCGSARCGFVSGVGAEAMTGAGETGAGRTDASAIGVDDAGVAVADVAAIGCRTGAGIVGATSPGDRVDGATCTASADTGAATDVLDAGGDEAFTGSAVCVAAASVGTEACSQGAARRR